MSDAGSRDPAAERERILEATIEVASESGYADATVDAILERAEADRRAFERHFRDKHDCVLAAWQQVSEECLRDIVAAYDSELDWPDRLRAVAHRVVADLRGDPARAVFGVEALAVGEAARARRDMTMRVVASLIDAGRNELDDPESVPHTTAEALAGSAYGQLYAKVVRGEADDLPSLIPQLMSAVVMPYLGPEAAMEELARAPEEGAGSGREPPAASTGGPAPPPAEVGGRSELAEPPDGAPELTRLPPGRHGLPREFVAHNHSERLIAGIAEAVAEHGYAGTTIAHITRAASVSRRTFYEHFASKDECFATAYETVMAELRKRIGRAFEQGRDWTEAVEAGIAAMLRFLAAEPSLGRLCMVEALVAGPQVVEHYDVAIRTFVPYLRRGREGRPPEVLVRLSPTTEEALAGGMVSLIYRRILADCTAELEDLLPDLVEFILTPYLGNAAAARVARRA